MLKFFKNNSPAMYLFIPIIIGVLQIRHFTVAVDLKHPEKTDFLYKFIDVIFSGKNSLIFATIISIILISIICYLFLFLAKRSNIFKNINLLHAFFYVFIIGAFFPVYNYIPALLSLIILLSAIVILLNSTGKTIAVFYTFKIGILLSISSLIYINSIYFAILLLIGFIIFRPFVLREWITFIFGLILPYFFLFSIYYLIHGNINIAVDIYDNLVHKIIMVELRKTVLYFHAYTAFILFVFTLIIGSFFSNLNINIRDYLKFFFLFFVISVGIFFLSPRASYEVIVFAALPASIPLAMYFNKIKRWYIGEIIFDVFLILLILAQTNYFF